MEMPQVHTQEAPLGLRIDCDEVRQAVVRRSVSGAAVLAWEMAGLLTLSRLDQDPQAQSHLRGALSFHSGVRCQQCKGRGLRALE